MIVKSLKPPQTVRKLKALLNRLPLTHPKRFKIEVDHGSFYSGYLGEKSLLYFLRSFSYRKDLYIFHNVRLIQYGYTFEIDLLIISTKNIILIEIKNTQGKLSLRRNQFSREKMKETLEIEVFKEPVLQVKSQKKDFISWMQRLNIPYPSNIDHFVVLTHKTAFIEPASDNKEIFEYVFRSENLPFKLEESLKKPYHKEISKFQLKNLSNKIMENQSESNWDVLKNYNVHPSELKKGIRCPGCSMVPMIRIKSKWLCRRCKYKSMYPLEQSLEDYALLVGNTITTERFAEFMLIESLDRAYRYLSKLGLEKTNAKKNRKYSLNRYIVK
ncbi:NERD domain-containing protein [Bacillus sp. H-16]|uniref:nuclease-related domain-containing protein n=1 Tax=Alteribacter salitolerans TaxID=2912333 RepID=UPI0019635729|nr:nuclease-related domain-containing protein [Alteribacter salitolerans]MBM7097160.1 NERD domain-containing protein [Alteribacter salitolerans]